MKYFSCCNVYMINVSLLHGTRTLKWALLLYVRVDYRVSTVKEKVREILVWSKVMEMLTLFGQECGHPGLVTQPIMTNICNQTSNISQNKFQNWNVFCLILQLPLLNTLKPGVKSGMKMWLEQRWRAPTTSEWPIILLPTKMWLILEVWQYVLLICESIAGFLGVDK